MKKLKAYLSEIFKSSDNVLSFTFPAAVTLITILGIVLYAIAPADRPLWKSILDFGGNIGFVISGFLSAHYGMRKNDIKRAIANAFMSISIMVGFAPYIYQEFVDGPGVGFYLLVLLYIFLLAGSVTMGIMTHKLKKRNAEQRLQNKLRRMNVSSPE